MAGKGGLGGVLRVEIVIAYGLGAERPRRLLLVRPDGSIAFRSDHLDFDDLQAFLHRFDLGDG